MPYIPEIASIEDVSNFDPEVALKELLAKDPYDPRLKPITEDSKIST